MKKLAILGHEYLGKKVVELLKMLGGKDADDYKCSNPNKFYYISDKYVWWNYNDSSIVENKFEVFTLEEFLEKYPYKIGDIVSSKYLKNYKIEKIEWDSLTNKIIYKLQGMGWYNVSELHPYKEQEVMKETIKPMIDFTKYSKDEYLVELGDYEIQVRDGKTYAVKKNPAYPTTYEECCEILGDVADCSLSCFACGLLNNLQNLLLCRDAYWQIAGEQMGLSKSWKPNWRKPNERKFCIVNTEEEVTKWVQKTTNKILAFPTPEMRDAFYENFKDLIEQCKELL